MRVIAHEWSKPFPTERVDRWTAGTLTFWADRVDAELAMLSTDPKYRNVRVSDPREGFPWAVVDVTYEVVEYVYAMDVSTLEDIQRVLLESRGAGLFIDGADFVLLHAESSC